jgi:RES domain-containing protein
MDVFHLGKARFADQLTGDGAKLHGGRWNLIGTPCIYTSGSMSLSVLEYVVNVSRDEIPPHLCFTVYSLPDDCWKRFRETELPEDWNVSPASETTKRWGTHQLRESNVLALQLPSVILPSEYNYVLNPLHPDFKKIKIKEIVPFSFDRRIKQ